jgi:hypothetical protein
MPNQKAQPGGFAEFGARRQTPGRQDAGCFYFPGFLLRKKPGLKIRMDADFQQRKG